VIVGPTGVKVFVGGGGEAVNVLVRDAVSVGVWCVGV
jgi:hypothetical protein